MCSSWLRSCERGHASCKIDSPPVLPTRALDVQGKTIRLVELRDCRDNYATLSWPWGDTRGQILLNTKNMPIFMDGMRLEDLRQTHQNAVAVTRAIGVRYLWIDTLCIIWDNMEDRQKEVESMVRVIANATFNIVAGEEMVGAGFLVSRVPARYSPCYIGTSRERGEERHVFVSWLGNDAFSDPLTTTVSQYIDAWRYMTPHHQRAWTMSEIQLARRNLVFQADILPRPDEDWRTSLIVSQLYMKCREEIRWENGRTRSTQRR